MQVGYTTSDKIRACLGLTDKELGDTLISDLGVAELIFLDLEEVYPTHALLKDLVDSNMATPEEQAIWRNLVMYVQYQGACHLLPQLQMIVVKKVSDGDAENTRFGPDNLEAFKAEIRGMKDRFLQAINPTYYTFAGLSYFGGVSPAYDPVTNEGA